MGRPFTASDDQILDAARTVISRRGPDAFSIAEVANEVGLSRAAIILRFKSTHALKVASLNDMVRQFAAILATLPQTPGGDNLLRVAAFIGGHMGSRESSVRFFANLYGSSVQDRELLQLERNRGAALDAAISKVMPETSVTRESAVLAFRAHLTGTITAWLTTDDPDSRSYLVMRTAEWLRLAQIGFSDEVVKELCSPPATATVKPARRTRTARTATGTRRRKA
ncbi:MAG TPA: TetR/AcrR family transcriptional regulator [Povalibacter sp.]|uniref:TetR/AcrR family transcriptional regulator n=1 Tax=Povalibacter sp. TaxID=1962978 RepID=UPI002C491F64|nr:TetR/AcrR family transcriptional regulator [Povalibacter sp.]HMN46760.1 TetR/AcrR family transcriptional regulator [Povalibacter sp.]